MPDAPDKLRQALAAAGEIRRTGVTDEQRRERERVDKRNAELQRIGVKAPKGGVFGARSSGKGGEDDG